MVNLENGINWIVDILRKDQSPAGSWNYPFETGIITDAYMIILLRALEINDERLIQGLAARIVSKQGENGAWKLFYDEASGNLTATVEAYYALLYSGNINKDERQMAAAKKFILANGGIESASMFTKIMLALTGQYNWPDYSPLPIEMILLPLSFPVNFYQFSAFGRANLAPIMILAANKYTITTKSSPDLTDLFLQQRSAQSLELRAEWRSIFSTIEEGIKQLMGLPEQLHTLAIERAKKYMIDHLEPDGTLYNYFSSTFLMIFALISLGIPKNDPMITKAIEGLMAMKTEINGLPHMQYTTAAVWNTALISYALQFTGMPPYDPVIEKANRYLLKHQQDKFGDWVIHNPHLPGGWGFSEIDTILPDVDDTTAALRSIAWGHHNNPPFQSSWDRGLNWLLSMQNDDGGWAAFEKNIKNKWIEYVPIEKAEFLLGDPSSADLTGRTLEFLGNYTNIPHHHSAVSKAKNWLVKNQEKDGSWYGRWGICYLYGTWAAVTGMAAVGLSGKDPVLAKAARWLKSIQNPDGGWGESCRSDSAKAYVPLNVSTLTHTAWALDSLISVSEKPDAEIKRGIYFLLNSLEKNDWATEYPEGQGMAGGFYIHYHSYRYIFPLLAMAHYKRKYDE